MLDMMAPAPLSFDQVSGKRAINFRSNQLSLSMNLKQLFLGAVMTATVGSNAFAQGTSQPRPGQTISGSEPVVTRTELSSEAGWRDYPADPALAISGDPKARFSIFRSKGDATPVHRAMLISLEPSKFRYRFVGDESWLVLKGRVTITLEDGQKVEMKPNDLISIKGGRNSEWEVHEPFLKFVVVSAASN